MNSYGISLGVSNAVIARVVKGVPEVIKTDTLKDTMPCCVSYTRRGECLVGDRALLSIMRGDEIRRIIDFKKERGITNTVSGFSRTLGTDITYPLPNLDRSVTPVELTAEVLKKLKSFVCDENVSSVVITVPAKFTMPRNEATIKAANMAGFKQVRLLQEPIAAVTAYGLGAGKKDGYWLVFDFGGGTFDVSLIKATEGIMQVKDTEGDNFLGGKNLDEAIVDQIILPHLQSTYDLGFILNDPGRREILRKGVKRFAEDAKIQMSIKDTTTILSDLGDFPFENEYGEEIEIDITITQKDMERVLAPVFQKAIDITKELLSRNNLNGGKLDALILVGGPTHSPILRRMLKEQITENVDTSVDPMTVVAQGAALFASTMDVEISNEGNPTNSDKIVLDLKYPTQTVEATEMVSIKVLKDKSGNLPNEIFVELKLFDGSWSTIKQVNDKKATIFDVELIPEKVNFFEINVRDGEANLLDCEQEGFTILQEFIAPSAPLPYHIGIAKYFEEIDGMRFCPIVGLEKNKELPATGGIIGFRTDKELRKGEKGDYISIPIYQGDYNAVGTELSLNNLIYEVVITGEKLPDTLPEGSIVDITIKIDESQRMYFRAYFPCLSYSEELKIEIPQEKAPSATNLADNKPGIRKGIRDALLKLPTDEEKWESVENELNENYDALTIQINRLSEDNIDKYDKAKLEDIRRMKQQIVAEKNIRKAKKLIKEINTLIIMIYPPLSFKRILLAFHFRFDSITWSNPEQARRLITIGMTLVSMGKDDEIIPIVKELFQLVLGGGGDGGTSLE